eukprot:1007649-Alexandrium_andersonii.AAC.1
MASRCARSTSPREWRGPTPWSRAPQPLARPLPRAGPRAPRRRRRRSWTGWSTRTTRSATPS